MTPASHEVSHVALEWALGNTKCADALPILARLQVPRPSLGERTGKKEKYSQKVGGVSSTIKRAIGEPPSDGTKFGLDLKLVI